MFRNVVLALMVGSASLCGPGVASAADEGESDPRASSATAEKSEAAAHELSHVVQQRQVQTEPAGAARGPGERIMRPDFGAGDSTDPEGLGRVKVQMPAAARKRESLSLNYTRVSRATVRVTNVYSIRNRIHVKGADNALYALADGTYQGDTGDQIQVQRGTVTVRAGSDVVVKGKKILQNYVPSQPSDEKTWRPIVVLTDPVSDGRYQGPGGTWLEVSNGEIATAGGAMEAYEPPPFYDVSGDGTLSFRQ